MRCETLPSIVCACLNNQVYCYGGEKALNSQQRIDSGIYALYLNKTQRLDQLDWEFIKTKNDFLSGERSRPQFAVISTWTQVNVEANGSDLTRATHSGIAILELPYADSSNDFAPTMLAYNVTNLSYIHPIDYYYSGIISTNTTIDQPSPLASSTPLPDIESFSAGAKAGIAVGSIVGAVAIFSALFLLYHKKPMKYMQPAIQGPGEQVVDEKNDLNWNNIERQYFELDTLSTTAAAESLYRNSTDQQALSPNANTSSTYTVLKTTEISQTPNVEITHTDVFDEIIIIITRV
ncbi:unnamed protein product [Rhizopus microsporus]|uniref:Uncharacterized protein n=1 Tax=Rhizopus microsporus TaxID=58291 RepID=A0A1X0RV52_RHIZD|nr:hypothetical protein BCV71DRAFT_266129 [Rhizopus microsporus]